MADHRSKQERADENIVSLLLSEVQIDCANSDQPTRFSLEINSMGLDIMLITVWKLIAP
jgi:hypothetical protein